MAIAGQANLNAANTTYETAFQQVFAAGPPGTWQTLTEKKNAQSQFFELDIINAFPRVRQWVGARQFKDFRAYKQIIELLTWEVSHAESRKKVVYDKSGAVGEALANFVRQSAYIYDDIIWQTLLANPTGYDAVSLLNDTHPNVASGATADNLTTSALTFEVYRAAVQAMELTADEDGRPLGVFPTHLYVGPAQRRIAEDIVGPMRVVAVDNAGVETGTRVAAAAVQNAYAGQVQPVVVPWITGNQWFLADNGKAGAKAMILFEARGPEAIVITDMNMPQRFINDEFWWGIECDASPAAGLWQLIYGSVTS